MRQWARAHVGGDDHHTIDLGRSTRMKSAALWLASDFLSDWNGMADTLTPTQRSERMSRIGGKNTSPEIQLRRLIHGLGYRFRLHPKDLPGSPDVVFPGKQKAIFVHGCFWHAHSSAGCSISHVPKSRIEYWQAKFDLNRSRDRKVMRNLRALGWKALVVWECQLTKRGPLEQRLKKFLDEDVTKGESNLR